MASRSGNPIPDLSSILTVFGNFWLSDFGYLIGVDETLLLNYTERPKNNLTMEMKTLNPKP